MTELTSLVGVLQVGSGSLRPTAQSQSMARGDTCSGTAAVLKSDGSPADLTGGALILTVQGLFSRQLDFISASVGTASFSVATADTIGGADSQDYPFDLLFIDNTGLYGLAGGRYQVCTPGIWRLTASFAANPPIVSVLPAQIPLGQGPQGPAGAPATLVLALPPPAVAYRGVHLVLDSGNGLEDREYVCLKNANGSYGWVETAAGLP